MTNKRLWLLLGAALLLADTSVPTGLDSNSTHFLNGLGSWTPPSGAITLAPQGRLTLQSGHPVMTADQAGVSLLYYDSYVGNLVPVYNGTTDVLLPINSGEISDTMQTSGTGVLNSGGVFDVWGINVGGTLTLCIATNGSGGGWASDAGSNTARGTGYSALDRTTRPYWTNAHAITHCYNASTDEGTVAINQATYLGTLFTVGAGQTTMQLSFESGAGNANPCLCVFNAYNRVKMTVSVSDSTASWTYSVATWRESRGQTGNQINWVDGLQASTPLTTMNQVVNTSSGSDTVAIGINLDTASNTPQSQTATGFSSIAPGSTASILGQFPPQIGFHTIVAAEHGFGAGTQTFNGGALMILQLAVDM